MSTPSNRDISDLCRQLGLISPLTRKAQDQQPNPNISELRKCLERISNAYRNDDSKPIERNLREIGKLADGYIEPYGGRIWHYAGGERAGVLPAGDRRADGLYPRDLYWDDPEDRK